MLDWLIDWFFSRFIECTSSLISRLPVRSSTLAVSPLWSSAVRAQVKRDKLSDREMNKLRSELPAPGMFASQKKFCLNSIPLIVLSWIRQNNVAVFLLNSDWQVSSMHLIGWPTGSIPVQSVGDGRQFCHKTKFANKLPKKVYFLK